MLLSVALIMITGLIAGYLLSRIGLPYIIGMLLSGALLGPHVLNLLDANILLISDDLRKIALIIILTKAGLSLDIQDLKKVGRPAILMSFLPALFEITSYMLFAPYFLGITVVEAGIMGAVISAVSPAVVIPKMTKLIEEGRGTNRRIPQMLIAGSSADDVFVIVVFTSMLSLASGEEFGLSSLSKIPVSIVTGILLGAVVGYGLVRFFKAFHMRDTIKVVIILSLSFLMVTLEGAVDNYLPMSGLLAVMGLAISIYEFYAVLAGRISLKFGKMWVFAEILLFVLVGAFVDFKHILASGIMMLLVLLIGLIFRLFGMFLCLVKTPLNFKEKLFCMFAEIPKATVQAAIGGVPLALGLQCGNSVLAMAVLSIVVTAPLGAFLIDFTADKYLEKAPSKI